MPVTIKIGKAKYKSEETGQYTGFNVVGETKTSQMISDITSAGANQVGAVNTAGSNQVSSVNSAGGTQITAINAAGNSQKEAVNGAGTTHVNAINSAGSTQVGLVIAEGERQIQDIEDKGELVYNSIPSDYTELSDNVVILSNAISQLDTDKQDAPSSAGTAGQVLGLDSNLDPVWVNQSGGSGYPKKVFDYEFSDNWYKCNVSAINYETGVIILEDNDAPFTDDYNTTLMVWCVPIIEPIRALYKWGFMPPELYAIFGDSQKRGVIVGPNQIKIYTNSTTSLESITQTTNIDFSRFQIWATDKLSNFPQIVLTDLEQNHRYHIILSAPYGGTAGARITDHGGSAYGTSYQSRAIGINNQNIEQFLSTYFNVYENLSFRGIKSYALDDRLFEPFPKFWSFDVCKQSTNSILVSGYASCNGWENKNFSNISANDTPIFVCVPFTVWLNASEMDFRFIFNGFSGVSFAPLDGGIIKVFDLGDGF